MPDAGWAKLGETSDRKYACTMSQLFMLTVLKVASEVLDGGQGQLVLNAVCQLLVVLHQLVLVISSVCKVEEQAVLQASGGSFRGCVREP